MISAAIVCTAGYSNLGMTSLNGLAVLAGVCYHCVDYQVIVMVLLFICFGLFCDSL